MTFVTIGEGLSVLLAFGATMLLLVGVTARRSHTTVESFHVADRSVHWLRGALSIAVSWIWAPAIFIASLQSYTNGIAGAFWFIVPNVVCFFIFAPVAVRLRKLVPQGYTFPEFILMRFDNDAHAHLAFFAIFFGYQLAAIIINCLAGGLLLHSLTGLDTTVAITALSAIALSYSLFSGLKASILTDVLQMMMILVVAGVLIPWVVISAGGMGTLTSGFAGVTGEYGAVFNSHVAYTMGIAMTLSLLSGPFADQMFFQRAFAVREQDIAKTFVAGGLIFAAVPVLLSLLGFIAAAPGVSAQLTVSDPQMVGPAVIAHFLPKWALLLFVLMTFCGLSSTLDSAYCAISSLGSMDIYRRYFNPSCTERQLVRVSRWWMLVLAVVGTSIALLQPKLLWVFLIYGGLASAGFFPTILSIFTKDLSREGVFLGISLALVVGLPLSIYANVTQQTDLVVLAAVLSISIGLVVCLGSLLFNARRTNHSVKVEFRPWLISQN